MPRVSVKKVSSSADRELPIFAEVDELAKRIRMRAFEIFSERASGGSQDMRDWLTAERELSWPAAELNEDEDDFELNIALAGFEPSEIAVTATPRELLIKAMRKSGRKIASGGNRSIRWSEFRSREVCRRVELPSDIDVKKVAAELENGLLKVTAPKLSGKKSQKAARKKARKVGAKSSSGAGEG